MVQLEFGLHRGDGVTIMVYVCRELPRFEGHGYHFAHARSHERRKNRLHTPVLQLKIEPLFSCGKRKKKNSAWEILWPVFGSQ